MYATGRSNAVLVSQRYTLTISLGTVAVQSTAARQHMCCLILSIKKTQTCIHMQQKLQSEAFNHTRPRSAEREA